MDPQYRHFAIDAGPYPAAVVGGVRRKLDEAVPPQAAGLILLPQDLFHELKAVSVSIVDTSSIGALRVHPFSSTANASRVKADGCLLTLKRGVNT
ncbi:hypothetical protein ACFFWD_07915 [Bradyrhizobium erythrophlei]|uniref:hypothetical protein n=1 Tax=Bradyrhizobium erythrophlei TaxID=1437360 RepID=UPI0035EE8BD9